jgi:hypothetical protein
MSAFGGGKRYPGYPQLTAAGQHFTTDGHTAPLILLSSKGAGPDSRSAAGHLTTAVRLAPRRS